MPKRYYIAYGSNLNVEQMHYRCPDARIIGTATLDGWTLLFKGSKTGSYLTIEQKEGESVPVAVWEVSPADEANLDRYEGFPHFYYKKRWISTSRGLRQASFGSVEPSSTSCTKSVHLDNRPELILTPAPKATTFSVLIPTA